MSIYTDEGYASRRDYLENLADDLGLDRDEVFTLASMLGSSEDFDGLVTMCEDRAEKLERQTAYNHQIETLGEMMQGKTYTATNYTE